MKHLIIFLLLITAACTDLTDIRDVESTSGSPEYAIPLINAEMSLEDVFNQAESQETELVIHPDSSLSLNYSGDVLMKSATDFFPPIFGFIPVAVQKKSDTIKLPIQRLNLIKAFLAGDSLIVAVRSNLQEDVDVRVEISSLTRDGVPVAFDLDMKYEGSSPMEAIGIAKMAGMKLDLYENSIIVNYQAFDKLGQEVDLDLVQIYWDEMTFKYVEGYFSKNEVNIPGDFIDIEVYDNWINGQLYFEDPTVKVSVDNAFGFPVRAKVNRLRFIGRSGQEVDLVSPLNDSINFKYPRLGEVGAVKKNRIIYNGRNSNIENIINIQPVRLEYDIDAIGNPDEDTTIIGFFTDSSFIKLNVDVDLPIHGWANNFEARDTVMFSLNDVEEVESAEFKMIFNNGMPIALNGQIYLLDRNDAIIDSIFDAGPLDIEASPIDQDGKSNGIATTTHYETVDADRIDIMSQAVRAILKVGFLTKDAPNKSVFITAKDIVEVKMGAKLQLK
jgi:hypothetical protein